MEFKDFLQWFISGGGGAILAYWFMENSAWLGNLSPEMKRYVSLGLPGVFAGGAWMIFVLIGYAPLPVEMLDRWEALFAVVSAAILAQVAHGKFKLSKKCCSSKCC